MALKIQTTGLENFMPGGQARLKVLCVGGPGVGKTRWSSYWPKAIYADCEGGLASVADRRVPYVSIRTSQDMLDFLHEMKLECMKPAPSRRFTTVVIDTLDAFQRKVQDEFLQQNPGMQSFRGYDAWGYLDSKMQMLMTRLLNLDMNVIVNVHYKDRTVTEGTGDSAQDRTVTELQLKGDVRNTAFNDFDLVGWMGSYYEAVDGQRVKKRGLTFQDTPDRPFLKDRLHITPPWLEVTFSEDDYTNLFSLYLAKLEQIETQQANSTTVEYGEIASGVASATPGGDPAAAGIVGPLAGGPLPSVDPKDVPLEQHDKPTLQKMCRDLGLKYQQNTIKAELIELIVNERRRLQAEVEEAAKNTERTLAAAAPPAAPDAADASPQQAPPPPAPEASSGDAPKPDDASTAVQPTAAPSGPPPANPPATQSEPGLAPGETVDKATGEVIPAPDVAEQQAIQTVEDILGGEVTSSEPVADEAPAAVQPPQTPPAATTASKDPWMGPPEPTTAKQCEEDGCTTDLSTQNSDWVRLSFIKWRKRYCDDHYLQHKNAKSA